MLKNYIVTKVKTITTTEMAEVEATDERAARMATYSLGGMWGTTQRPADGYGAVSYTKDTGPVTELRTVVTERPE